MPNSRLKCKNHTQSETKIAKIDTLFLTKMSQKPYPLRMPLFPWVKSMGSITNKYTFQHNDV